LRALDDNELPAGSTLNREWSRKRVVTLRARAPQPRSDGRPRSVEQPRAVAGQVLKTWRLPPGAMAPEVQSHVYRQVNGVGRVNPSALREIDTATATPVALGSSRWKIQWQTAAPSCGEVFLYKRRRDP